MHVLIVHQAFASLDEPGGTRHYEFARLLAARGHRVTVIASPVSYITGAPLIPHPLPAEEGQGVRVVHARVYSAHHKSFFHRLIAFFSFMISAFWIGLGVKNVDLVWGTSPPIFQGVTAWLLARLKRVRFLFEVRDLWPEFAVAVGVLKNPVLIRMSEWLERFLYERADRVMVNSPGFIAHVISRGAKQVDLIANGADPSMFDPADDGADFRRAHHLEDKFIALYAGAHGLSNDLGVLLDAAKSLMDERRIQIVLLGDGKEKRALQTRAVHMGLSNVSFVASVPKSEMPNALAAADACIAILKPLEEYKTTYPNKVFDYMAAGRPIALAIDGVIRQVVEAAQCGYFVEPGDPSAMAIAIRQLASDPRKDRTMGMSGRQYLEAHFSREAIGETLIELLEEMAGKHG
ncbi:MAG TPA: glycosyltransferase family 4 protein [Anaerolineales bacterium]|nr:glycosyltransferase family 4 protein [Anaerolineales bacterium]